MRVLIVEDQIEILEVLRRHLEQEWFVVDGATDGQVGADLAHKNDYDLIILDNHLPSKMGIEICSELRSQKKRVPIIILSVQNDTSKKVEFFKNGADDFVAKPFSIQELIARIHALMRRPRLYLEEEFHLEDLTVNISSHSISRGKNDIRLTKKEFLILEQLMRNQGQIVSREKLVEHAWDMNANFFSNTVETHIGTLRKKIDTKGKKKLIHTISGRGYKLGAAA